MEHSFRALVWLLATVFLWATSCIFTAASEVTRATLFHSTLWMGRLYLVGTAVAFVFFARALYHAWNAGEIVERKRNEQDSNPVKSVDEVWEFN